MYSSSNNNKTAVFICLPDRILNNLVTTKINTTSSHIMKIFKLVSPSKQTQYAILFPK